MLSQLREVREHAHGPQRWRPEEVHLPDWAALESEVEAKGAEDATNSGFDAITLRTHGFEPPHLLVLDAQRQLAIDAIHAHLAQQELAAQTAQVEHAKQAESVGHDYARARAVHETARGRVERLEIGPSQWPGDGKPSSIAILGGWREVFKQWGVPLLVLLTVEVPIYYQTFLGWGGSTTMAYALVIGAIFVFVFGPHFYGRKFREWEEFRGRRHHGQDIGDDTGRDGGRPRRRGLAGRPVILFLTPVIWLAALATVGSLRLLMIDNVTYVDSESVLRKAPWLIERWGLIPAGILVFALMIFTALIATELGRRMGNPNDRDLKEQRTGLRYATQVLKAAEARQAESDAYASELAQYLSTARQNRETHTMRVEGGFDHLETIYMDALIRRIDDPKALLYGPSVLDGHQRRRHDNNKSDT
ncbi:hypothetical protein [Planotetraspora silvatica]|uniref:hypothetical protein n=1 Tax=Planotetraspora silvatica TaxID=234614 RepID=UPI00194F0771|nr:hypothetical protein [Planotetraspora silvatica]